MQERRRAPRYAVWAEVEIVLGDDTELRFARNLSMSGAFVDVEGDEHPDLRPGARLQVVISRQGTSIRCPARVVRREPSGMGVLFEDLDPDTQAQLRALIVRASREQGAS